MTTPMLRFRGAFESLSNADRSALLDRRVAADSTVVATTSAIIARVRTGGDAALRELAEQYDRVTLPRIEIPRERLSRALESLDPALRAAMERTARNLETVSRAFAPAAGEVETEPGVTIGRRPDPLARVGVYAPGGRASYPSSVLMAAVPARAAGVGEIVLCSPPDRTGEPAAVTLAAAALAGVDRVFAVGGAGAVAAMALGTETIPRVDRIVGPGNAYVAAAKVELASEVGIDSPAGPSELVVIADDSDPDAVAVEMVAQAEHDPSACVVAAVIGERAAARIERALEREARSTPRADIVARALAGQGAVLVFESPDAALRFTATYAPEHLLLATRDARALLPSVRNAGTVFIGTTASVAFGDYMTGGNHVLPTGGSARVYSGLSPLDFVRWTTYQVVTREGAAGLASDVVRFAEAESLPGHAAAARRLLPV